MVYTRDLKSLARKSVWVRVPPRLREVVGTYYKPSGLDSVVTDSRWAVGLSDAKKIIER